LIVAIPPPPPNAFIDEVKRNRVFARRNSSSY
jgi:hypothetical protein